MAEQTSGAENPIISKEGLRLPPIRFFLPWIYFNQGHIIIFFFLSLNPSTKSLFGQIIFFFLSLYPSTKSLFGLFL